MMREKFITFWDENEPVLLPIAGLVIFVLGLVCGGIITENTYALLEAMK